MLTEEGLRLHDPSGQDRGITGAEEQSRLRDVADVLGVLFGEIEGAGALRGDGLRGGRRVDGDAVVVEFRGKTLSQSAQCSLAGAVHAEARAALELGKGRSFNALTGEGDEHEHPALFPLAHGGNGELRQVQWCKKVHFQHQARPLLREVVEGPEEGHRSVVDEDVGRTNLIGHTRPELLPVLDVGEVRPDCDGLPSRGRDGLGRLTKRPDVFRVGIERACGDRHDSSFRRKPLRDRLPDAPAGPRDQGHLPFGCTRHGRNTRKVSIFEPSAEQLEKRLAALGVEEIRRLAGGASGLTYAGTAPDGRRVVAKVAPPGLSPVLNRDVLRQSRLLRALSGTPVPVPEVIWEDVGDPPEVPPLFVMSFVEGSSFEPLFDADGGGDVATVADRMRTAARTMAALHALDPPTIGLRDEPIVGLTEEVERWCRLLASVETELAPGWEEAAGLLRAAEPSPLGPAVVHGDFRLGNMLATGSTVRAVIDWEIWTIGDPRVDLGWFLVNADPDTYRRKTRFVDALPTPEELAAVYGAVPDVTWFEALACFKSVATWSRIVKHNRRRPEPDADLEMMAGVLPRLLQRVGILLSR
jgi:aminoglycoside phosphotransferase (APT) family kinase protein